jgi:predicted Zn-dependent protease
MKRGIRLLPLVIAGLVILFQFFRSERFVNPETGRAARVALSPDQESALGLQSFREVLASSDVISSGPEVDQVVRVVRRLAGATGDAARGFEWGVSVIRSPQVNAFCLPGGKIAVYTGILPVAENDAGLAAVLGHEMAHATARHGSQRLFQQNLMQTAMVGAAFSLGDYEPRQRQMIMGALGAGTQFGILLPFSRDHEIEADQIGLMYMARAGFDPREAIRFWERMAAVGRTQPPEFASTHPSHGTRIERLEAVMPKALAEYEQSRATVGFNR